LLAEIEYRAKSAEGKVRHPFYKGPSGGSMTTAQPSTVWAYVNTSKQVGDPADMGARKAWWALQGSNLGPAD
jgi:hypothetical protein